MSLLRPGTFFKCCALTTCTWKPPLLQKLIDRDPIHPGRLHGDRVDAAGEEPIGQGCQIRRIGTKHAHWFSGSLRWHRCPDFTQGNVQPSSIRMHDLQPFPDSGLGFLVTTHVMASTMAISWLIQTRSGPNSLVFQSGSAPSPNAATTHCITPDQDHAEKRAVSHQSRNGLSLSGCHRHYRTCKQVSDLKQAASGGMARSRNNLASTPRTERLALVEREDWELASRGRPICSV